MPAAVLPSAHRHTILARRDKGHPPRIVGYYPVAAACPICAPAARISSRASSAVRRSMISVRLGPASTWQCRQAWLQSLPTLIWTVSMPARLSWAPSWCTRAAKGSTAVGIGVAPFVSNAQSRQVSHRCRCASEFFLSRPAPSHNAQPYTHGRLGGTLGETRMEQRA